MRRENYVIITDDEGNKKAFYNFHELIKYLDSFKMSFLPDGFSYTIHEEQQPTPTANGCWGFSLTIFYFRIILNYFLFFYRVGGPEGNKLCQSVAPLHVV